MFAAAKLASRPALVAGHISLDIHPELAHPVGTAENLVKPGGLTLVGPARLALGGTVGNVGAALHRLGVPVTLIAPVGTDLFGSLLREVLAAACPGARLHLLEIQGGSTSYTVILNPPDLDRAFLHHSGVNDQVTGDHFRVAELDSVCALHFGYPTVMAQFYRNEGKELEAFLKYAAGKGVLVSLDVTLPDPESEAGRLDWRPLLQRILPHVDVFSPNLDEARALLRRPNEAPGDLAEALLGLGAAVVLVKMGPAGAYLTATRDPDRLEKLQALGCSREDWRGVRRFCPPFEVVFRGSTGAGDAAAAGLLAGILGDGGPGEALQLAAAAGAACVEAPAGTAGIPTVGELRERIRRGWKQGPVEPPRGWRRGRDGTYRPPDD
ncbi:MAG: hypothetical protein Kow00109_20270 [Acidobacteriota bacterium]